MSNMRVKGKVPVVIFYRQTELAKANSSKHYDILSIRLFNSHRPPMSSGSHYDPDEDLLSPWTEKSDEILYGASMVEFTKVPTPTGLDPSPTSSVSSPPQSMIYPGFIFRNEPGFDFETSGVQLTLFEEDPGCTLIACGDLGLDMTSGDDGESILADLLCTDTSLGIDEPDKLVILAEPRAFYRDRYPCETDPQKHRAQRYIRTEDDNNRYEYPTIKIPRKWLDPTRQIYIRVTPVTVPNKNAPYPCTHPYEIDTQETNVLKHPACNSLYFRLNENEFLTGEKSFHISRKKMVQNALKSYGPFRLFGSNEPDSQRLPNPQDAKQKIGTYQLWRSQFVFTIAERQENSSTLTIFSHTSVESQIMVDQIQHPSPTEKAGQPANVIKCVPQRGLWLGGDEVLIVMPHPVKRKMYKVFFDFGIHGHQSVSEVIHIDTKTISFRTPPCPFSPGDEHQKVSIIVRENNINFCPTDFYYMKPIETTVRLCPSCRSNDRNNYRSNKRPCEFDGFLENNSGESLVSQMNQLSLELKIVASHPSSSSDVETSKFDKYLNQLREALAIFVRTNDPSRLFRRTRVLLSKDDDASPLLNDAIQRGHIQLASSLLEQVCGMPSPNPLLEKRNEQGVTPLLMAAKCNEWGLIELMLKKRADLAEQIDDDGNNLFHILADVRDDEGADTMRRVGNLLGKKVVMSVGKKTNGKNQTAREIAQARLNSQCEEVLRSVEDENA